MNVETGWNLFDILDILVFTSGIRLKTFFSTTKEMKMPEKLTKCTCKRCQTCSKKAQDRCVSWQPKNVFFLENIPAVDPRIWKIRHVFENWHVQGRNQIFLEGVFITPTQLSPVNIAKSFRTSILKNICEWLLLEECSWERQLSYLSLKFNGSSQGFLWNRFFQQLGKILEKYLTGIHF